MTLRPVPEIAEGTLRRLVCVALTPRAMCALLDEPYEPAVRAPAIAERLVRTARRDPAAAERLEGALDRAFAHTGDFPRAIAWLCPLLRIAMTTGDGARIAAVLWCAARHPGVAWRCFERRAEGALELAALQRLARTPSHPPNPVTRTLSMTDDCTERETLARAAHMRVDRCGCGALHLAVAHVTLRFDEDALTCLYETLGEALGSLALRRLRERPALRLLEEPSQSAAK